MAIDILSIPASSCDCERMFSEIGDLLEPKRRKLGPQILSAAHCVRVWMRAGFRVAKRFNHSDVQDSLVDKDYGI